MTNPKYEFLKNGLEDQLQKLREDSPANWGKMNAQQMLEHVADFFDVSAGKIKFPLVTPQEHLPKYMEFLRSDKEFRENTKAPAAVLGEEPLPYRTASVAEAKARLQQAINDFFTYHEDPLIEQTVHPVFGPLGLEDWVLLHHKHVQHHLKQFGLV